MFAAYQHPHASASTSSDTNYSFSHPPPLPLNAYAHQAQSELGKAATSTPPQAPPQQFTGAYGAQSGQMHQPAGDISPETSAAPPAIARHQQQQHPYSHPVQIPQDQQYIDFQQQQQQQQQQPQVDPNFVTYQAQPPTQPYDYSTQPQQQADFTNQHAEYQQQQQQVEFQNGSNDYAFDQQYQMQMMGGEMDMNMAMGGMGMMGVKRPRGEKISSKDFIPPDVTGMSKREARLVKNRAAAFLSRQRKREEFEAMESRVADLEAQNTALLTQLGGAMPAGDAAHAAHIRALQARIAGLEHELLSYRARGHGQGLEDEGQMRGHRRQASFDSFDSSQSGKAGATKMSDGQREAVIGMGLMALLSLSSMSPPTTKFAFAPAEHVEEPTPVTATPFNYDSIARWQERLAQTGGLATVPDEEEPKTASNPSGEPIKSEFDIAFSTTDDGRIRCHVSVPKAELGRIAQIQAAKAPLGLVNSGSYPATPYSHAGSLHSHSSHSSQSSLSLHGNGSSLSLPLGNSASPESLPPSHPGSASSFHTTFEAAGYQVGGATLGVPEEQWVAQHAMYSPQAGIDGGLQLQAGGLGLSHSQEWAGATPIAPHPPSNLPVKQEPEPVRKQLGPTRRVKVALKASSGRGEWEVEVC